jgi:hypothetical protein
MPALCLATTPSSPRLPHSASSRRSPSRSLRMQKACDSRPADQMTKSPVAALEVDSAKVVPVEVHEIECPEHEAVLGALVRLSVEFLEAVGVHEFSIDNGRSMQRCERGSEPREALCWLCSWCRAWRVGPPCRPETKRHCGLDLVIRKLKGQLAFLCHPFKRFTGSFYAVLKLRAIRRKQAHNLVQSMHRRQSESRLSEINDLPHFELVARHVCLLIHSTCRHRSTFSAGLVIVLLPNAVRKFRQAQALRPR